MNHLNLFLLLLSLPFTALAQDTGQMVQPMHSPETRIGISLLHDAAYRTPYQWRANEIGIRLRRTVAFNFNLDRQLHPEYRALRAITHIGFHRARATTTDTDLAEFIVPADLGFTESFTLDYLHISSGLLLEPYTHLKTRPYLSGQLILTLPTKYEYTYRRPTPSLSGIPQAVDFTGDISPGLGMAN